MSLSVITDVFCDGAGCNAWTEGADAHPTHAQGVRARANARLAGWVRRNGLDLCPYCKIRPEYR